MFTLNVWYYRGDNRADSPEVVSTVDHLDAVLEYLQGHDQPHPTQIAARELPTIGVLDIPDRMFKLDVSGQNNVGALLYRGPDETLPDGGDPMATLDSWTTRAEVPVEGVGPLFIDKANRTEFPADAVVPLDIVRQALLEFRATGKRPTCVAWQKSDSY